MTPRNIVLIGDAGQQLRSLSGHSVDMVVTSPPYFNLRDYGVDGQIGLEGNAVGWVESLAAVAHELHRVLTPSGTFWLNVGDAYSTHARQGALRKSLLLAPEQLALRLIADGWILRNKIVWQKANPLPSSVRDRLTCTWEYVFVFAKQPRYHFNLDAVRVPHISTPPKRHRVTAQVHGREPWRGRNAGSTGGLAAIKASGMVGHPLGKNPGDIWRIAASNYRGAHRATYPVELARRAIRAGAPKGGLVLDPFFGAGTTGLAAEQLGRDWLGIELNPVYAELAMERIRSARASPVPKAA